MTLYSWKQATLTLLCIAVVLYVGILVVRATDAAAEVPVMVVTYGFAEHGHVVRTGSAVWFSFKHQHSHDGVHRHTREELGQ